MYYLMSETDLVSLQLLLVLNLANIFIMFFLFYIFLDKRENVVYRTRENHNENYLATYQINFDDIINEVYSDSFPYEEKCSICLEDFVFTDETKIIQTEACNHFFHETCIKQWLRIRTTCPNCQNNLVARHIENNN